MVAAGGEAGFVLTLASLVEGETAGVIPPFSFFAHAILDTNECRVRIKRLHNARPASAWMAQLYVVVNVAIAVSVPGAMLPVRT